MSEGGRLWKVKRGTMGSRIGFVLAAIGSAVVLATFGVFRILPTRTVVELFNPLFDCRSHCGYSSDHA